ncbi:hypothetical protein A2363_02970 [Candidatus Gottesmanbacteria bacterium RIFOXYB1_FULL_47_11]|uniref:Uncharacterized protein n=1 Tax=Candidatus Gottesmanbacteria bacterium RIFOXYB1_FULL_47_11 TaxID=1798401 RepID=A0A1F6BCE4_9BACT|nr:MAG: hypothetical protein A2363_02970 [Candidatus Gottesmanbacteria bacterium RIFOXYB1_FULL_47_11]
MSLHGSTEMPRNSIYRAMTRHEQQQTDRAGQEIVFGFKAAIAAELAKPSLAIDQETRRLAQLALEDLNAPPNQGHLIIFFIDAPGTPLHHVQICTTPDCPDEPAITSTTIAIALNTDSKQLDFWRYREIPSDLIHSGVQTLAKAATTLAQELKTRPGTVLYRSEMVENTG